MLLELTAPVVNVNPPKSNIPIVNVVVPVAVKVNADPNVVVPAEEITNAANVLLPLLIIVPVPTIVAVKLLNVPPLDNVRLLRFKLVVPGLKTVEPKSSLLNQLPVVNVCTAVPLPVNVRLILLVIEPPVVPNVNVLVILAGAVNPPVPV